MPDKLSKVQSLLLEAASIVAKLQSQPEPKLRARPKPGAVERFVSEQCFVVSGALTEFTQFKKAFFSWLPEEEANNWTSHKIIAALPVELAYGRYTGNKRCIGNLSLVKKDYVLPPFHVQDGRLVSEGVKR